MSGLFDSQTEAITNDPYEYMPDWLKDVFKDEAKTKSWVLDKGKDVTKDLMRDPREVLGPSDLERQALEMGLDSTDLAALIGEQARAGLDGNYESDYTDAVVDTTLAGMDRNAQREALARESANAAIGGTSNTRQAVADALAGQLHGMDRAQMEAQLRDSGFRFGKEMTLEEAGLLDQMATSEQGRGMIGSGLMGSFGEMERGLTQQQMDEKRTNKKQQIDWLGGLGAQQGSFSGPLPETEIQKKPSIFNQVVGAGTSLVGAFMKSDERVKEDISAPSTSSLDKIKLLKPYEYRYKDGHGHTADRTTGIMAQDVERAGITGGTKEFGGVKHVDPYAVLATVVGAVQELEARSGK